MTSPLFVATIKECPMLYITKRTNNISPFLNLKSVNRSKMEARNIGNIDIGL
jgi:hypothetical protein